MPCISPRSWLATRLSYNNQTGAFFHWNNFIIVQEFNQMGSSSFLTVNSFPIAFSERLLSVAHCRAFLKTSFLQCSHNNLPNSLRKSRLFQLNSSLRANKGQHQHSGLEIRGPGPLGWLTWQMVDFTRTKGSVYVLGKCPKMSCRGVWVTDET